MRYENGNLILDDVETEFLSTVAMEQVDCEYPAPEFIASLAAMKDEAEKYIRKTQAKQAPDKSDSMRIEITNLVIEMFDELANKGHKAVEAAGGSVRWH